MRSPGSENSVDVRMKIITLCVIFKLSNGLQSM